MQIVVALRVHACYVVYVNNMFTQRKVCKTMLKKHKLLNALQQLQQQQQHYMQQQQCANNTVILHLLNKSIANCKNKLRYLQQHSSS